MEEVRALSWQVWICIALAAAVAAAIVAPRDEPAVAQPTSVAHKSDSLLSPTNIRRLFAQKQADEAAQIEAGLIQPTPLPQPRPRRVLSPIKRAPALAPLVLSTKG
jgi:hypothetical protein